VKTLETTMWSRSSEVLSLAAGIAGQELKRKLARTFTSSVERLSELDLVTRVEQARQLADSLGRLKGAFMKAGQLLSIDASEILPPEAQAVLASLQGGAEPVPFETLWAVVLADLDTETRRDLVDVQEVAAASASMGQVHRATVHGIPVALKIQYPGVRESIDADLAVVHKLARSWLSVSGRDIDLRGTFDEVRTLLHLEADYTRERSWMDRFGEVLAGDPRFVVPQSFPRLCSSRILTMTWEDGVPLGEWTRSSPSHEDRVWIATTLLDLYGREFFEWGFVQTDPNFANFLVRPRSREVVLLDFGATVEYDLEFRRSYVELLRVVGEGIPARIVERGIRDGLVDPREDPATMALFVDMMQLSVEPFFAKGAFRFSDDDYAKRSRDVVTRFTRALRHSPPPRRLLFLHRKLGGLFQLMKRLDVELDLGPYWEQFTTPRVEVTTRSAGSS
jgi:aarF domain-containing kinase